MVDEYLRYLGCISLLAEAYRHVPEEMQEQIERALDDAEAAVPSLRVHRRQGISMTIEIEAEQADG